jgi:hypothetical protein
MLTSDAVAEVALSRGRSKGVVDWLQVASKPMLLSVSWQSPSQVFFLLLS